MEKILQAGSCTFGIAKLCSEDYLCWRWGIVSVGKSVVLGLIVLILVGGVGAQYMHQQNLARIRDYTSLMTQTHGEAIDIYNEARHAADNVNEMMARGEVDPDEVARIADLHREAAEKTREAREKLGRVIAPPEAESLQKDGLEYLDTRVEMMELGAQLMDEIEKLARGQGGSESKAQDLSRRMGVKAQRVNQLSDTIRETKDAMVLQN
jgi:hypothetical protein